MDAPALVAGLNAQDDDGNSSGLAVDENGQIHLCCSAQIRSLGKNRHLLDRVSA